MSNLIITQHRHLGHRAGVQPRGRMAREASWTPDQVRGDELAAFALPQRLPAITLEGNAG